jgi:hypothetical protein
VNTDAQDVKALADVEAYGCHILSITDDTGGPDFCYSIGINKTAQQPDLLVFGLPPEVGGFVINEYNRRVRAGEVFTTHLPYYGFLDGFPVYFGEVPSRHFEKYLGFGLWFYRSEKFRVLQVIYPNKITGGWPWDKKRNPSYTWHQPLLSNPTRGNTQHASKDQNRA